MSALFENVFVSCGLYVLVTHVLWSHVEGQQIYREDPLGTLKTEQKAACEDDLMLLKCPQNTTISIQLTHYGRKSLKKFPVHPSDIPCAPNVQLDEDSINKYNSTCLSNKALQIVVESCQEKQQCKFEVTPKTFGSDPCPGVKKYMEVAYKCRPREFRSKIVCQDDVIDLQCSPNQRIAVYSSSFGRTQYGSLECPQTPGEAEEDCQASFATETVMQTCHGKRRCSIKAESSTFGAPCRPKSRMYLKVVYTCVPREILKERYQGVLESDEETISSYQDNKQGWETTDNQKDAGIVQSAFIPKWRVETQIPGQIMTEDSNEFVAVITSQNTQDNTDHVFGFVVDWMSTYRHMTSNVGSLILYIALCVGLGMLCCIGILLGNSYLKNRKKAQEPKLTDPDPVPHVMDFSELEIDLDPSHSLTLPQSYSFHSDGNNGTLKYQGYRGDTLHRQGSDTNPRSLSRHSNNTFYYG